MGGNKGGTSTQNQITSGTSTTTPPPDVLAKYGQIWNMASGAASQPFQPYTGEFVAPVNPTQAGGINTIAGSAGSWDPAFAAAGSSIGTGLGAAYGALNTGQGEGQGLGQASLNLTNWAGNQAQPYNTGATGLALAGTQAVDPSAVDSGAINSYMNPYMSGVVDPVVAQMKNLFGQQQQGLTGSQILNGTFGSDRGGIGKAVLGNQQDLALGQTVSGLYNSNYAQALAAAQQQQGVGLGAAQANRAALQQGSGQIAGIGNQVFGQGLGLANQYLNTGNMLFGQGNTAAGTYGNLGLGGAGAYQALGTGNLTNQLTQGQAQLGAGTVPQQTQQAQDTAVYNQWLQQQGYPFQVAQFLAGIGEGIGALSGSTTTNNANAYGSSMTPQPFFSDERLKEDVRTIGHTKEGMRIVRYNYKDDPDKLTRIGFLAHDVEEHRPDAVGLAPGGYKTVDYDKATRPRRAAGGGLAPQDDISGIVAAHQAMYPGAVDARGINGSGPRGMQLAPPAAHQLLQGPKVQSPELKFAGPSQDTGLRGTMQDINTATTTGKNLVGLGRAGKEVLAGSAGSGTPGTPGYVAPSGGLVGSGGDFGKPGWFDKTFNRSSSTTSSSPIASTSLPPLPSTSSAPVGSSYDANSPTGFAGDTSGGLYARGGRTGFADGGMPYGDAGGYVPVPSGQSPVQLLATQKGMETDPKTASMGATGGGGGGGALSGLSQGLGAATSAMSFATALMALKTGGRAKRADGGGFLNSPFVNDALEIFGGVGSNAILGGVTGGAIGSKKGLGDTDALMGTSLLSQLKDGGSVGLRPALETGGTPEQRDSILTPTISDGVVPRDSSLTPNIDEPARRPAPVPVKDPRFKEPTAPRSLKLPSRPEGLQPPTSDPAAEVRADVAREPSGLAPGAPAARPAAPAPVTAAQPPGPVPGAERGFHPEFLAGRPNAAAGPTGTPTPRPGRDARNAMLDRVEHVIGITESGTPDPTKGWDTVGPPTTYPGGTVDRPYGRYGVMGSNVGPWTKQWYGKALTPSEFLTDKDAQRAVVRGQFGSYVDQFGNVSKGFGAWFAGPNGLNSNAQDVLGTSVPAYMKRATALYNGEPDPGYASGSRTAANDTHAMGPLSLNDSGQGPSGLSPGSGAIDLWTGKRPRTGKEGFFDENGWLDRNQREVAGGLSFLGNMLGSDRRTLAGSVGQGLAAAAPFWMRTGIEQRGQEQSQQGIAQEQQRIDISNRQQLMSLWSQLLARRASYITTRQPIPPELDRQITHLEQQISQAGNGPSQGGSGVVRTGAPITPTAEPTDFRPGGPSGSGSVQTSQLPAPAGGGITPPATPAAAPPVGTQADTTGQKIEGPSSKGQPALDAEGLPIVNTSDPGFLSKLDPDHNPQVLAQTAASLSGTDPAKSAQLWQDSRRESAAIVANGFGIGPGGQKVYAPGGIEREQAEKRAPENEKFNQVEQNEVKGRQQMRSSLEQLAHVLETYETGNFASAMAEMQGVAKTLGIDISGAKADAASFQKILKDSYQAITQQGNAAGVHNTDSLRDMIKNSVPSPEFQPEANKQLLSQMLGQIDRDDKRGREFTAAYQKNRYMDAPAWEQQWQHADENAPKNYIENRYASMPVRGATPSLNQMKPNHLYILEPGQEGKYGIQQGAFQGKPAKAKFLGIKDGHAQWQRVQ